MLNKYTLGLVIGIGLTAIAVVPASATNSTTSDHKIGICHATGSKTNPYVYIVVDKHATHAHAKHQHGRDIIGAKSAKECPGQATATPTPSPKPIATPTPTSGSVLGAQVVPTTLPETGGGLSALIGIPAMLLAGRAYLRRK